MKTIKLATKTATIAVLLLTTSAAQATPTPTTTVEILWQWLFPVETQSEQKYCPEYPDCYPVAAPKPMPTTEE